MMMITAIIIMPFMLYPLMLLYLMLLYVIWHGIILTIFDRRGSIILSLHRCSSLPHYGNFRFKARGSPWKDRLYKYMYVPACNKIP